MVEQGALPSTPRSPWLPPWEPVGTTCRDQPPCRGKWPAVPLGSVDLESHTDTRVHTQISVPHALNRRSCLLLPRDMPTGASMFPCTDTYKWPCHNPVYTHAPVSTLLVPSRPCRHRRDLSPCWHAHTHTHVRPVADILTRWCGYTPAHAGVGRLSDSCQTAALLGISQVPAADQGELGF